MRRRSPRVLCGIASLRRSRRGNDFDRNAADGPAWEGIRDSIASRRRQSSRGNVTLEKQRRAKKRRENKRPPGAAPFDASRSTRTIPASRPETVRPIFLSAEKNVCFNERKIQNNKITESRRLCLRYSPSFTSHARNNDAPRKCTASNESARDCFRSAQRNSGRRYIKPAQTPSKRTGP